MPKGNANHADSNGDTALIQASHNGHAAVVAVLQSFGVDLDAAAIDGVTQMFFVLVCDLMR